MKLFTKRNQLGFTIIEVMIVLAIAGVIMLALFLAVPALQRNSRNNQRSSDAALVAASVNECLNNRNGQIASCNTFALLQANGGLDTAKLRQLTTVAVVAAITLPANTNTANIAITATGVGCQPDGSTGQVGGGSRAFAVLYNVENSTGGNLSRCLSS